MKSSAGDCSAYAARLAGRAPVRLVMYTSLQGKEHRKRNRDSNKGTLLCPIVL